jgi:hypothetical protein
MNLPFTATNGVTITRDADGDLTFNEGDYIDAHRNEDAAREFFAAEERARLGVGAHPDFPGWLFFRRPSADDTDGRAVLVLEPDTLSHWTVWEKLDRPLGEEPYIRAGHAWLDANPDPQAWEDAKPREVWNITTKTGKTNDAWVLESGAFMFEDESFYYSDEIAAGYRMWPKEDS